MLTSQALALEPEDVLRNMPSPEINYPINEIRVITPPALMPALPAEAVDQPQEKPSYEAKKLLNDIQKQVSSPVIDSTRKLVGNLSRPTAVKKNKADAQLANSSATLAASNTAAVPAGKKAIKPQALLTATGTRLLAAVRTLASNTALLELRQSFTADSDLAGDIFALYLEQPQDQEGADKAEDTKSSSYDSVLATAIGMYKKSQWQELKNLFVENPEAGETPDGLKYQVEAELNSEKPNYMAAKRFADQLLEADKNDPIGNYAVALFFYNSKKPNLVKAQQALDIALKAKKPPDGAANLYWTMTFKKFAIPLIAVIAGIIAGITQLIKKRKAANALSIELGDQSEPVINQAELNSTISPSESSGFKAKLQHLKDRFLPLLNKFRRQKTEVKLEITPEIPGSDKSTDLIEKTSNQPPETPPLSEAIISASKDAKNKSGEAETSPPEDSEEITEIEEVIEEIEEIEVEDVENTEEDVEYEEVKVEEVEETEDGIEYEEVEVEELEETENGIEYEEVEVEEQEETEDGIEYEEVEVEEVEETEEDIEYVEVEVEEEEEKTEKPVLKP